MNRKILATIIVAIVAVAGASGAVAYHVFQTKNPAKVNALLYTVTISYHCETVPNENGVIRVVGTVTDNYNFFNSTFSVTGYFYLKNGNQPDIPQIGLNPDVTQTITVYNNSTFGGIDFNATGNPSDYHLVFKGENPYLNTYGNTAVAVAENGVPCNLKLVDQTK
jgi:hypothetical protein